MIKFIFAVFMVPVFAVSQTVIRQDKLKLGKGTATNKEIVFDTGSGAANPKVRWNQSNSKLELAADGSTYNELRTGATVAINDPILSATAGSLLYAGASGVLAQSNSNLYYDYVNHRFTLGGGNNNYRLNVTSGSVQNLAAEFRMGSGASTIGVHLTDNTGSTEHSYWNATSSAVNFGAGTASSLNLFTNGLNRFSVSGAGVVNISNLTASRALTTDASKNLVSSSVTDTELGYLSGVTSAVQTQINGKQSTSNSVSVSSTITDGGVSTATTIATGTWTPSDWNNLTNFGSLTATGTGFWYRIGKMVYVQCALDVDPAAASTVTSFDLGTLPVTTGNFTSIIQAVGHTVNNGSTHERVGTVHAIAGSTRIRVSFPVGTYVGSDTQYVVFTYQVQ